MNRILFTLGLIALTSCSKAPPPNAEKSDMLALLPSDTLGYGTIDFDDQGMRSFVESAAYAKYMQGMQKSMESNPAAGKPIVTYLESLSALKLFPDGKSGAMPYRTGVFFATSTTNNFDLASYYELSAGQSGTEILHRLKDILTKKGVVITSTPDQGFEGVAIKPFEGMSDIPPALAVYRNALGIETIYVGATESRVALTTSKTLLDRAFAPSKDEFRSTLNSPTLKQALTIAGGTAPLKTYGMIDVARLAPRLGMSPEDLKNLPLELIVFGMRPSGKVLMTTAVAPVIPRNEEQRAIFDTLPETKSNRSFVKIPGTIGLGISIDGAMLSKAVQVGGTDLPPEQRKLAIDTLATIQSINLGVIPPSEGSAYPDVVITLASTGAEKLKGTLLQLASTAPLPATAWQDRTVGNLTVKTLNTPFGVRVNVASSADAVVIATGDQLISQALGSAESGQLERSPIVAGSPASVSARAVAIYMDFPKLMALITQGLRTAQAFIPQDAPVPVQAFDQMQGMGQLLMAVSYSQKNLVFEMNQELPE